MHRLIWKLDYLGNTIGELKMKKLGIGSIVDYKGSGGVVTAIKKDGITIGTQKGFVAMSLEMAGTSIDCGQLKVIKV